MEEARGRLPHLHVEEIDITQRPDVAIRYRVISTPAIAINGRLEFSGVPRKDALLARLRAAADAVGEV